MARVLRFDGATRRDPAVERWFDARSEALGADVAGTIALGTIALGKIARDWFAVMRDCGDDVRELLHDGHPTACIGDAGFAYVNAFTAHVNVGFFRGATLPDPTGLLEGTGKYMRHVKLRPGQAVDADALRALIRAAHADMRRRVAAGD